MAKKATGKHSRNKSASQDQSKSAATSSGPAQSSTNGATSTSRSAGVQPPPASAARPPQPASSFPLKFRLLFMLFPLLQMLWQLEAPLRPFSALRDPDTGEVLRRRVPVPIPVTVTPGSEGTGAKEGGESEKVTVTEEWKEEYVVIEPRVLVVIPHVRDLGEFAPTLGIMSSGTRKEKSEVFVVGLSVGGGVGVGGDEKEKEERGRERSDEWASALEVLGVERERGFLVDVPELQDDSKAVWDPNVVSDKVFQYVLKHNIDTILTFDEQGITGNPQHAAVSRGVTSLVRSQRLKDAINNSTSTSSSASDSGSATPERIYPRAFLLRTPSTPLLNLGPLSPIIQHLVLAYRALFSSSSSSSSSRSSDSPTWRRTTFVSDIWTYVKAWKALAKIHFGADSGGVEATLRVLWWAVARGLWVNEWVEV